ncbi:MAG: V-type ATPase subunit [Victivallales bacterium]|nr:V-type ATPase subunit [Victivallales bacterium]
MNVPSTIAPGQDFVFANLHGRWSRFLRGDELRRVVQSGSPDVLLRALAGRGVQVADLGSARSQLVRHLGEELSRVVDLLGGGLAEFYTAFLRRFWYEDLKTVLHVRIAGGRGVLAQGLLVDLPRFPRLPIQQMLEARDAESLLRCLSGVGGAREGLDAIVVELLETEDIPRSDAALDCLFFAELQRAAGRCPLSARQVARGLVELEIDTVNLVTVLRNRRTYQLPKEEILQLCVPGGEGTDEATLELLAEVGSPAEAAAILPRHLATCLRDRALEDLAAVEDDLRELLYRRARAAFRDYDRPVRSTVAYPYLKWVEVLNLGRLCEGMRFGMLPAELSPMLIGEASRA